MAKVCDAAAPSDWQGRDLPLSSLPVDVQGAFVALSRFGAAYHDEEADSSAGDLIRGVASVYRSVAKDTALDDIALRC